VLEATVELLAERGYGGTSTRLAAERAGMSLGALQHHFRTKAELSVEALRYASRRLAREFVAAAPADADTLERFGAILDRLFVVFRGDTFAAAVEVHLAARTDPDLQEAAAELNRDVEDLIHSSARELLPEMIYRPEFPALLQTSLSAVRGLALTSMVPLRDRSEEWRQVRSQLLLLAESISMEDPV
jgi:AcrR family transcriptional regulator